MNSAAENKISDVFVLIPSYNHAPFIQDCIRSVIEQKLSPAKLLVIDDGSRDASPTIIERMLKECSFDAELIVRENRGLCATLNQGFSMCKSKYFAYIGSDDIWLPDFLSERVRLLDQRENAVLAYGHALFIDDNGDAIDSTDEHSENWANYPDGDASEMLLNGIAPVSSTVTYRSSALEKVSWNEASRLEDYEMYLNLMRLGEFAFDPQVLSAWRHHGYNTSGDKMLMLKEVIEAQNRHFPKFGIAAEELTERQVKLKFHYARDFLRLGDKRTAWTLGMANRKGANFFEFLKFLVRMGIPMPIVEMKRRARKQRLSKIAAEQRTN
jgi:alpha-1,3-rhamnosyltransferase